MNEDDPTSPASAVPAASVDDTDARAKLITRRAWYIFGLSLPLSLGASFLRGGLPYGMARAEYIWGYCLALTAVLGLIPAAVIAVLMRPTRNLIRARISLGLSIFLICVIVYTALFGI